MKELGQILDLWRKGESGVLATVVQVKGSSYRRTGARLLMLPDGRRVGSVSGGCLEGDLSRKAWWLTEEGQPVLRTYDTTSDQDAVWEFGLGCNGVIEVLLERLDTPGLQPALRYLDTARALRETARIATVIRGPKIGARLWLDSSGESNGTLRGSALADELLRPLRNATENSTIEIGDSEIFLEYVEPPQPLIVIGAGHDAMPLVNIAKELGWHVTVADTRPAFPTKERFPAADEVSVMRPDLPFANLAIPPEAAVVLMTHNYPQDRALLPHLLDRPLRYLGILGPRIRTERLFTELQREPPAYVHAPVGLDIGSGSPETIALAIAAEISATLANRSGLMLRDRLATIYDHAL